MKFWIKNILQNIINMIESEEDKTLPKGYFKDIIIELNYERDLLDYQIRLY